MHGKPLRNTLCKVLWCVNWNLGSQMRTWEFFPSSASVMGDQKINVLILSVNSCFLLLGYAFKDEHCTKAFSHLSCTQSTNQRSVLQLFLFFPTLPTFLLQRGLQASEEKRPKWIRKKSPHVCTFGCFSNTCGMKAGSLDRPPHNLMGTLQNHFLFTSEQLVTFGDSSPTRCLKFSRCNA